MFRIEVLAVANFSLFTIHFSLNERFGVSLAASRRFAVSDTACCSFLTLQRYYISIAVYEYISKIILSIFVLRGHLVIWSFVKIENRLSKSATII